MNLRLFLTSSFITVSVVAGSVFYSHNGLRDLFHLQEAISRTQDHVDLLNDSNRKLRRRVDLVRAGSSTLIEEQLRMGLGMLKPGETLYLESSTEKEASPISLK